MENAFVDKRPLHIHALPDDLLLRIVNNPVLADEHRFKVLPLVCKRWSEVAPQAVESATCIAVGQNCRARLLALHSWLAKHGAAGSLRRLRIEIRPGPDSARKALVKGPRMLALLVHSVLPACSHLHDLELDLTGWLGPFGVEGWAANLLNLRSLDFSISAEAWVTAQLHGLAHMQELTVSCYPLTFSEGAVLPPSLTRLKVFGLRGEHLPPQLAALTALQALDLHYKPSSAGGYDSLTALTWLKWLRLQHNHHLPSLSALTRLSALDLRCRPGYSIDLAAMLAAAQEEALRGMPNLVHLTLFVHNYNPSIYVPRLPATLAALSRLQSLVLDAPPADEPALPPGPYLASLTRLELHVPAAMANLQQLSEQAGQLAQFTLLFKNWVERGDAESRAALATWAGLHAPLQRLRMVKAPRTAALEAACQWAQQRKPGLQIEFPEDNE